MEEDEGAVPAAGAAANANARSSHRISTDESSETGSDERAGKPADRGGSSSSSGGGVLQSAGQQQEESSNAAHRRLDEGRDHSPESSREKVHFVHAFMNALCNMNGPASGKAMVAKVNPEMTQKRMERKRQINRESARRKRLRSKQEVTGLAQQVKQVSARLV